MLKKRKHKTSLLDMALGNKKQKSKKRRVKKQSKKG